MSDMKPFVFDSALVDPLDIARRDQIEFSSRKFQIIEENLVSENHSNSSLAGLDMINHMILGNRTLICVILLIFIHTCARKILLS